MSDGGCSVKLYMNIELVVAMLGEMANVVDGDTIDCATSFCGR